jgi:hypothetical protein
MCSPAEKHTATCLQCGATFIPLRASAGKYCSATCSKKASAIPDRECKNCGVTFSPTRRVTRYCSAECRTEGRAKAGVETRICAGCGKEHVRQKKGPQKYCSLECANKYKRKNGRRLIGPPCPDYVSCIGCGAKVPRKRKYVGKTLHCSLACALKHRGTYPKHREDRTCPCCGKVFNITKSSPKIFCSVECRRNGTICKCVECGRERMVKDAVKIGPERYYCIGDCADIGLLLSLARDLMAEVRAAKKRNDKVTISA